MIVRNKSEAHVKAETLLHWLTKLHFKTGILERVCCPHEREMIQPYLNSLDPNLGVNLTKIITPLEWPQTFWYDLKWRWHEKCGSKISAMTFIMITSTWNYIYYQIMIWIVVRLSECHTSYKKEKVEKELGTGDMITRTYNYILPNYDINCGQVVRVPHQLQEGKE